MKKIILSAITTSTILLSTALPALAVDDATSSTAKRPGPIQKLEQRAERLTQRLESRKDNIASREAALKAKLQVFKDKRKAEVADRVNTNLNMINKKRTDMMMKHLDKMSEILAKVEARVNSAPADKDTTAAKKTVADTKAAIDSAKAAVTTQAGNDYTITVTSETTVKTDAKAARDKLFNDLKATHQLVISAKQAVANAIRVTATTLGGLKSGQQ